MCHVTSSSMCMWFELIFMRQFFIVIFGLFKHCCHSIDFKFIWNIFHSYSTIYDSHTSSHTHKYQHTHTKYTAKYMYINWTKNKIHRGNNNHKRWAIVHRNRQQTAPLFHLLWVGHNNNACVQISLMGTFTLWKLRIDGKERTFINSSIR